MVGTKKYTMDDFRGMSDEELQELEQEDRNQILSLNTVSAQMGYGRHSRGGGRPHLFSLYRKRIARVQTILNERRQKIYR